MKKLLALLLALAMVFAMMTCLTACGEDETDNNEGSSQSTSSTGGQVNGNDSNTNTDNNTDNNEDNKNDAADDNKNDSNAGSNDSNTSNTTSSFTFKGVTFTVPGSFKELSSVEDAIAISNGTFTITLNYSDTTSDESTEEATQYAYNSIRKSYPEATVELLKTEDGISYYTIKGWDYADRVFIEYVHDGKGLQFSTGNFTDEAIYAITHVTFG